MADGDDIQLIMLMVTMYVVWYDIKQANIRWMLCNVPLFFALFFESHRSLESQTKADYFN